MVGLRFAVVKSTRYNDLWVSKKTSDPFELYKSTLMRCSPIGLAELFHADFLIVKESMEYPCQEITYGWEKTNRKSLLHNKKQKLKTLPFLDETYHEHLTLEEVSYDVDAIDWSEYDIVITMNACVPTRITQQYPRTLWCTYVSENDDVWTSTLFDGYKVILNQDVRNNLPPFAVGFPYSFCGPTTIERIGKDYLGVKMRSGIFIELNNSTERPFLTPPEPFIRISQQTNQPLLLHDQNVLVNCKKLSTAKYYVKLLGRVIRGNGVVEAISAGCLLLMNPSLTMYSDLVLEECRVVDEKGCIEKIRFLEEHPQIYIQLVQKQRDYFTKWYVETPLLNLIKHI